MSQMRGKFIVLEGLDRSGKSSIANFARQYLESRKKQVVLPMRFPDRDTTIGKMIGEYLSNKANFSDQAIHLLFSANRWEKERQIEETLQKGVSIVCDRYWLSGVAYSCAKGLDSKWCITPDKGLTKPDLVIFLDAHPQILRMRPGYGDEKYEQIDFQKKVYMAYQEILQSEDELNVHILKVGEKKLDELQQETISVLDKLFL